MQLRGEVRAFIHHTIGDGRRTWLWFDSWLPSGPILPNFNERVIYDSALPRWAKVASIISNGQWAWPVANSPDLLTLKQAIPDSMVPNMSRCDEVIWSPSGTGKFSTKSAWLALRVRHSLVNWHRLIWFSYAIPKCGFILWLAIRERLSTYDRLSLASSTWSCLLCNNQAESHDHLFFSCSFSRHIWEAVKQKCSLSFGDLPWKYCISQMVSLCKGKSLSSLVRKLALAASVYYIWSERNSRFHDHSLREAQVVLWAITDIIRYRLSSVKGFSDTA